MTKSHFHFRDEKKDIIVRIARILLSAARALHGSSARRKTCAAQTCRFEAVGTCASRRPRRCASCDRKRHGRASRAAPPMAFGFASRAGTLAVAAVPSIPCLAAATLFTITSRRVRGMLCAWMRPAARCTATRAMTGSSPSRHGSRSCGPSLFPSLFPSLSPRPSPIHRPRRRQR